MTRLLYPDHPGCSGATDGFGGAPSPCQAEPTSTVAHTYSWPRRYTTRLMVCDGHAVGCLDVRPMTAEDRAELDGRRVQEAEALAGRPWIRVGRGDEEDQ